MKNVTAIWEEGWFWLTKFVGNSKDVLVSIPEGERRKGLQDQELRLGTLPTEKALGIHWNIEKEKLSFDVNFKDKPYTKREMLSMVSSIYDPFALVSSFVLEERQIMQMLCLSQLAQDDPVDKDVKEKWIKWKLSLKKLQEIKLNRCYKPKGFGKVVSCSFHYFSDASENGYGQATYLRLVGTAEKVHCSLLIAKSRVAPMKYTSIPRLELAAAAAAAAAAVLSTKMSGLVKKELGFDDIAEYYWTNSQAVIGYLRNTQKRFKVFVANRVQQIRESTDSCNRVIFLPK